MDDKSLIRSRDAEYGQSWLKTGRILALLGQDITRLLIVCPDISFNWIMILNKLVRALVSPHKKDHWDDIIGYAQLTKEYLERKEVHPNG